MVSCSRSLVVIGGGISGLSSAFYALRQGVPVTIIEASPRLGGLIRTDTVDGCQLEAGPDSFLAAKPAVQNLARDLGIEDQLIGSNDASRRIFIARQGELMPMPPGMVFMVPTDLAAVASSPLFTTESHCRFALEEATAPFERPGDFSIGELVESHFGAETLQYIAEPLLSGVYGGDPAKLSARSVLPRFVEYERVFGSLIQGARQEVRSAAAGSLFRSFAGGMGQLVSALEAELRSRATVVTDRALSIRRGNAGRFIVACAGSAIEADNIVLAVPAYVAAELLQDLDRELAAHLNAIPYSSAVLGTFLFDGRSFPHALDGFGFLVPRPERRTIAAATWINTKFPSRVAPGLVALRAFVVDPEAGAWMDQPDGEVGGAMLADLYRFMGNLGVPVSSAIHRWPRSMPQYVVGHGERVRLILRAVQQNDGIQLVSNYLDGIGIPDCIRGAEAAVMPLHRIQN